MYLLYIWSGICSHCILQKHYSSLLRKQNEKFSLLKYSKIPSRFLGVGVMLVFGVKSSIGASADGSRFIFSYSLSSTYNIFSPFGGLKTCNLISTESSGEHTSLARAYFKLFFSMFQYFFSLRLPIRLVIKEYFLSMFNWFNVFFFLFISFKIVMLIQRDLHLPLLESLFFFFFSLLIDKSV